MQNIHFKVEGQRIENTSDVVVVAKSKHEYKAVFSFSSEWEGLENKVAYFKTQKLKEPVFVELQDNGCEIPAEALETPYFTVSVAAGDLKTATICDVAVEETGYSDTAEPALSPKDRRRYADSLILNGKKIQLTEAGTPIGGAITLPDLDKFELWNDITLEEDVLSITVTKTDRGNSIRVKKLVLLFIGKIQAAGIFMLRNSQATIWPVYANVKETANNGMFWAEIEKIADGVYFSKYTESFVNVPSITDLTNIQTVGSTNRVNLVSNFTFRENETSDNNKTMKSLRFGGIPSTPNCKLLSGSRILIWGVMDDD